MTASALDNALHAAIAEGLLPAGTERPAADERPWPVVLLTAFGAWLAAIPLLAVAGLLLFDALRQGAGTYIVGGLLLGAVTFALRRPALPLFVEQILVPLFIVAGGMLAFGLYRDQAPQVAAALLALLALATGAAVPRPWLRVVLGAASATLLALMWMPRYAYRSGDGLIGFWMAWHLDLALWILAGAGARSRASAAFVLQPLRAGWLLATLAGLAWWSGMTFLVGATFAGGPADDSFSRMRELADAGAAIDVIRAASFMLAVGAAGWAARRWPTLRTPSNAGVAVVLCALAGLMPVLGAALLALAVCTTARRWRLAACAALTAVWIVGGFYYQLAWPLVTKALVLMLAGAVLGALAWRGVRSTAVPNEVADERSPVDPWVWRREGRRSVDLVPWGLAASALLVLVVANGGIWQKEALIANGRPVFIALAPVDPRSLMQGDYMRLNFGFPVELRNSLDGLLADRRPSIVARLDERHIATLLRVHGGEPIATGEALIELTPRGGDWVIVTDAWSFREGDAPRWARAKYGEFRVDASGRALLVGLRGPNLEPL